MRDPVQAVVSEQPVSEAATSQRPAGLIGLDSVKSWYVLGVLTLSFSLAYIDRQLLNLLVDPIRHSLSISDTQLSLIQGIAFISAYLVASPLFGRLVDVTNRRNVLVAGICVWSIFTALSGRADTYLELFGARVFIGASEACVFPVGCSLIADMFSARRVPLALSILVLAPQLGGGASLLAGGSVIAFAKDLGARVGFLQSLATWQLAFVVIGLPGLLIAALVMLTVREPARGQHLLSADSREHTLKEAISFIWERRALFGRVYIGLGMLATVMFGLSAWFPSYLIRSFGVPASQVGLRFGSLVLVFGAAGVLGGPWFARQLEKRGYRDATLRASACSVLGMLVCSAAVPFAPSTATALAASTGAVFFFSVPTGILASSLQLVTPSRMRGVVGGLHSFCAQLIGFGLGPTSVALVNDQVFHRDLTTLGYSIGMVCTFASACAACLLFSALAPYRRVLDAEQRRKAA